MTGVFLYEGLEVSGTEWLPLMSVDHMPVRQANRRHSQLDQDPRRSVRCPDAQAPGQQNGA